MKLLADADYFVGIAKDDDVHHKLALITAEKFQEYPIYITPYTIPEVVTVLSNKVNQKKAKDFLQHARLQPFIELPYTRELYELTDIHFLEQNKKGTSWIDCFNIASIQIHRLDGILSFDKFYKTQGIKNFAIVT